MCEENYNLIFESKSPTNFKNIATTAHATGMDSLEAILTHGLLNHLASTCTHKQYRVNTIANQDD